MSLLLFSNVVSDIHGYICVAIWMFDLDGLRSIFLETWALHKVVSLGSLMYAS